MKVLGWMLLLSVSSVYAQQVIEPAPLSIEDDGSRKIIVNPKGTPVARPIDKKDEIAPPKSEALAIPNDDVVNPPANAKDVPKKPLAKSSKSKEKIAIELPPKPIPTAEVPAVVPPVTPPNPQDGHLTLDPTPGPVEKVPSKSLPPEEKQSVLMAYHENSLRKYLQFSFGYINSRYEKVNPILGNGSQQMAIKIVADVDQHYQTGFAIEILSDRNEQAVPNDIRSIQYRLFVDYHNDLYTRGVFKMDWVGGLSLAIGDYGIVRRFVNAQGQEVSVKLKNGTIVGLIPAAGLRFYLVEQNSFDLMVEYHQYFGNPQKYIGGLAISPRINFTF